MDLDTGNSLNKEEHILVHEIRDGNTRAFKSLVEKYFKELAGFAAHFVTSSQGAKDIVQEVFATIWETRTSWNPHVSVKLYLYQSVKNEALNHVRKRETERKYMEAYANEQPRRTEMPENQTNREEFKKAVQQAIQQLPDRARLTYQLHRRDGLTYREIAQVMDISHKTVESQMSRALQILRKHLSKYLPIVILTAISEIFLC